LLHYLDLSNEFDTIVVILGKALNAFDGYYETGGATLSLNNSSKGAFTNLFDDIVIGSNLHPVFWKTERLDGFLLL